jgi:hypothetical protein
MSDERPTEQTTRREVIKRAAYVAPAILTLAAFPAFAQGGSGAGTSREPKLWSTE